MSNHSSQNLKAQNVVGSDLPSNNNVSDNLQHLERQASQETAQQVKDPEGREKRKKPVMWPTAAAREEWESFDEEVNQVLESVPRR